MIVVISGALFAISSTRCAPLVARTGSISQDLKVPLICLSRSSRSVTMMMRGFLMSLIERQGAAQHHHGQRLAGALRVPDHAALARAVEIELLDALDRLANAEELLVAGDLADAAIEHGEAADHDRAAARGGRARRSVRSCAEIARSPSGCQRIEKRARVSEIAGEDGVAFRRRSAGD